MGAIDPIVYERHLRANISKWPVTVRHGGKTFDMAMESSEDTSDLFNDGPGLQEGTTISLQGARSDFGSGGPRDALEIKMRDGKWKRFEIVNVPDRYDPVSPAITCTIGNPDRTR